MQIKKCISNGKGKKKIWNIVQGLSIWLRKVKRFWEIWIFIECFFYTHRNFPYAGRFLNITDQGSFLLLSFNLSSMCWGARNWQISPKMDKFDKKIKNLQNFLKWKPKKWHRIHQYHKIGLYKTFSKKKSMKNVFFKFPHVPPD